MWLRCVRAQGMIGQEILALAIRYQEDELPAISARPGCVGTGLGINVSRGSALSLTFWDDRDRMVAGKAGGDETRDRLAQDFRTKEPYRIDDLEVVFVSEMLAMEGAVVTPYIHIARFDGLTDETSERMTEVCLRDAEQDVTSRGCEGVVVGADRAAGVLSMISFWENQKDMRAVRTQYTGTVPGVTMPYTDNFELVVARDLVRLPRVAASQSG